MSDATKISDGDRGTDFGNIPWFIVDGHQWHWWNNAWGHYPHHCPPCQVVLDPTMARFLADAGEHLDNKGHLMRFDGTSFAHRTDLCDECRSPIDRDDPRLQPGRSPEHMGELCPS